MSTRSKQEPPAPFEPEFVVLLTEMFEERIVFNKLLGLKLMAVAAGEVRCRLSMRPELIGHYTHQRLHGGVISAVLDAVAGIAALVANCARHMDEPPAQRLGRFVRLGTIDMRIDYLRPGTGAHFDARAQVIRLGSRVASTRMELLGADGTLLATGAGAYMVS